MSIAQEKDRLQSFILRVRYIQFIFLAVLFYGSAMLSYDLVRLLPPPIVISAWSIGSTIFGAEGAIASYVMIRSTEGKIAKLIKEAAQPGGR